jgi:5-deoxy-glucuronate isomerase
MSYLYRAQPEAYGTTSIVSPPQSGLTLLKMARLLLRADHSLHTGPHEMVLDVLSGTCTLTLERSGRVTRFEAVGQRVNPFTGPPDMVYVPPETTVSIQLVSSQLTAVMVYAPCRRPAEPVFVRGESSPCESYGQGNWQRVVYPSIGLNVDAERILMGETHTPSGNWSSYPPHKHDQNRPPAEVISEEIYHFLIDPPYGFGLQYLWTAPGDPAPFEEAYPVHNGDTVVIPRGYHPVVVAPGFRMVTVWAFAGEERRWGAWAPLAGFADLLDKPG